MSDQDSGFLEFAAQHGLRPGTRVTVVDVIPEAESLTVRAGRRAAISLALSAAAKILVDPDG